MLMIFGEVFLLFFFVLVIILVIGFGLITVFGIDGVIMGVGYCVIFFFVVGVLFRFFRIDEGVVWNDEIFISDIFLGDSELDAWRLICMVIIFGWYLVLGLWDINFRLLLLCWENRLFFWEYRLLFKLLFDRDFFVLNGDEG